MKLSEDILKRLDSINQHFSSIEAEKFNENLEKAGFGRIKPASESGYMLSEPQEKRLP